MQVSFCANTHHLLHVDANMSENKDKTSADDDINMSNNDDGTRATPTNEERDERRDATLHELETGLAPAANGLPHQGGDNGAVGADEDGLYSAESPSPSKASSSSSLDTEEVVAFAMECDEEDSSGQEDSAGEPEPSATSSGKCLDMAKYFVSSAGDMLREHEKARKEADMYMAESSVASGKLVFTICAVFSQTFPSHRVWSGWTGRSRPCARPRCWPRPRTTKWTH